jgi:hypothetical protein
MLWPLLILQILVIPFLMLATALSVFMSVFVKGSVFSTEKVLLKFLCLNNHLLELSNQNQMRIGLSLSQQ